MSRTLDLGRRRSESWCTVVGLAAMALGACASDPQSEGAATAPTGLEGLFEVSSHEVQVDCEGDFVPVAELPEAEAPPTTPFFILVSEPGPFGSTQLVALACDEEDTCDVEQEFRLFYDLDGQWKYVTTRGRPNDADGCDLDAYVDTLTTENGGDDIEMEMRVTADSVDLEAGETTCAGPVQDYEPEDLPCVRVERILATRIAQ